MLAVAVCLAAGIALAAAHGFQMDGSGWPIATEAPDVSLAALPDLTGLWTGSPLGGADHRYWMDASGGGYGTNKDARLPGLPVASPVSASQSLVHMKGKQRCRARKRKKEQRNNRRRKRERKRKETTEGDQTYAGRHALVHVCADEITRGVDLICDYVGC